MNSAESFSADFAEARVKFRAAAAAAGGELEIFAHPEPAPDGSDLSTDVAWFGPKAAERVLVMISATHGVEGFCGSGAQIDWLQRGEAARLPPGVGVLMVHAINPYGFAWLRRVTQENVDLNRNWIDFAANTRPANKGYDALSEAICPRDWDRESQGRTAEILGRYAREQGPMALQQAVSGGQYDHPAGVFFGGEGPTWSRRTQTAIFASYLSNARKVAIIDYHTGLGPWGYGELIVTHHPTDPAFRRAAAWYGACVTSPAAGNSTSAEITGDGLGAAPALLPSAEVTGMALEVGTQSLAEVMLALRADAWLHAYGDPLSSEGGKIMGQVRAAFYGDADDWKGMVAGQSLAVTRQALAGLCS
ncbi:MAG TPA: M14 family metallopeptidase [Caulobacteraceae bacterium]